MRLKWVEYGNQLRTLKYLSVHCTSNCDLFLEIMGSSADDVSVIACIQFI